MQFTYFALLIILMKTPFTLLLCSLLSPVRLGVTPSYVAGSKSFMLYNTKIKQKEYKDYEKIFANNVMNNSLIFKWLIQLSIIKRTTQSKKKKKNE